MKQPFTPTPLPPTKITRFEESKFLSNTLEIDDNKFSSSSFGCRRKQMNKNTFLRTWCHDSLPYSTYTHEEERFFRRRKLLKGCALSLPLALSLSFLFLYLFTLSLPLSLYLFISLYLYLFASLSLSLSLYLSIFLSFSLSLPLCFSLSLYLSLFFSFSLSLFIYIIIFFSYLFIKLCCF